MTKKSAKGSPNRRATRVQHQPERGAPQEVSEDEVEFVEERSTPRTPIIYEVVRHRGEDEMVRPLTSLWWSGVAAGLSISFSLLAQAVIYMGLPDVPWRPLASSFGYSVGFLMVILSRQQLFTENTITVVLPVMADFTLGSLGRAARMWGIVLSANLAGTLLAALFCTFTPVIPLELRATMLHLSGHVLGIGWSEMLFKGVAAGFLVAAMVWLLPGADTAQFHVVTMMTFLIAAGGFMHIVAGSMEAFMLVANGDLGFWSMLTGFIVPVLLGNIVGGTALFALLSYGQVMMEI